MKITDYLQSISIIFLILFSFFVVNIVHAQEFQLYSEDDIFVESFPKVPGPNKNVSLKLNSYSFNLNNYYIAWFKDGERQSEGYGQREFEFTTGDSGTITEVIAVVEYENQVFRKELSFAPSQVDLLWEVTDGYAPPFYKGKVLPIQQSNIRITAIPETLLIEPSDAPNLVYYWDRNYKRQSGQSGFGRSYINISADPLGINERITVTSNDRRENSFATNTVVIPTNEFEPEILFYEINENNRLLTNRALNNFNVIAGDTIRFAFHPLHMSSTQPNFVDLFVNWTVNNQSQAPQDFGKQNELYITSGGEAGSTPIIITLEGIDKLLQSARESVNIIFNP